MATVYEVSRALFMDEGDVVERLLTTGFEPFALDNGMMYFRRSIDINRTTEAIRWQTGLGYVETTIDPTEENDEAK